MFAANSGARKTHLRKGQTATPREGGWGGGESGGEGGNIIIMHGRRVKNIDPRIPTMPGRSTLDFYRPGREWGHKREVRFGSHIRYRIHRGIFLMRTRERTGGG